MAPKHRNRRRDAPSIANRLSDLGDIADLFRPLPTIKINIPVRSPLVEVEDRRIFHPDRVAPVRSSRLWKHRLVTPQGKRQLASPVGDFSSPTFAINFGPRKAAPYLAICVRRKQRREVLLALGRGGRNRRPTKNQWSTVRC